MTRIADLNKNDVIEYIDFANDQQLTQLAIVNQVKGEHDVVSDSIKWEAQVEKMNGEKVIIDNSWDFVKSNKPFSRKLNTSGETEIKVIHQKTGTKFSTTMEKLNKDSKDETEPDTTPEHYQGKDGVDVIDFVKQQLSDDHFKGFMLGNIIKYSTRAGRKDDELEDIKKAKVYCERLIDVLEE
ncbi:DUF3310 domain-containing protein [Staphylococcus sp. NRL 18/288]|nr:MULTISPECIES: DUF3310 domain-containing protein [unclassified Staphylococcus]MCJ1656711.1 DUF3310 domain-containing protein [Staphylococcus sp. NRL 21/187]MCJ1662463.1 DUF3310 domain-containing protein [Staphylococcus sp. NRL 18/288]